MSKPSPAAVIAVLALFVALGGAGMAATGGTFILGKTNSADATSYLSAPVQGGNAFTLSNLNTAAGSSALRLNVASGHPPFITNSTTRVSGLNADRLDGINSSGLVQSIPATPFDPSSTGKTLFARRTIGFVGSNTNFLYMPGLGHYRLDCNADSATLWYFTDTGQPTTTVYHQVDGVQLGRATIPAGQSTGDILNGGFDAVVQQGGFGEGAGAKLFTATIIVDTQPASGACFVQGSALVQTS